MTRAGGQIGIPGLYVTEDPGATDDAAEQGSLSMRFGLGWAKSHSLHTGQCPVMKYHRAPQGYADFDGGAAKKFVIDPHKMVS